MVLHVAPSPRFERYSLNRSMPKTLVIGYGNPLRQDDGIGWVAASRLRQRPPPGEVEIIPAHQLMPEMAEPISRADGVLFLDLDMTLAPGQVRVQAVEEGQSRGSGFTHHVSPATLLAMARALYGAAPRAFLVTGGGEWFGYGDRLSPDGERAVAGIIGKVEEVLRQGVSCKQDH